MNTLRFFNFKPVLLGLAASLFLAGCSGPGSIQNKTSGALIGGVVGGAACANVGGGRGRIAATIGCTLIGAMIGGAVGARMDETDELKAQQAITQSATNEPVSWYNPSSQTDYKVTPIAHPQKLSDGSTCREFSTTATIDGKSETVYGTACQQADGSWQMKNH